MNFKDYLIESYYLASDTEKEDWEPRRLQRLDKEPMVLVYDHTLDTYKSLLGHSANSSSHYNYIYQVDPKKTFTWSPQDFESLIKNGTISQEKVDEYWGKRVRP